MEILPFEEANKPVTTWIPKDDYYLIRSLAEKHNITVSAYIRAIIVDVIQEENYTNKLKSIQT
jgi:hypothetical protein